MRKTILASVLAGTVLFAVAAFWTVRSAGAEGGALADAVAQRALRNGDRGQWVSALQTALKAAGFDPGPVDGLFGPLTAAAVRTAQAQQGLPVDGIAGRLTVAALTPKAAQAPAKEPPPAAEQVDFSRVWTSLQFHTAARQAVQDRPQPAPDPVGTGVTTQKFALTFNGRPDPDILPQILVMLDRYKVKATFFIYGESAAEAPALVTQIAKAGHEVANNGQSDTDLTRLGDALLDANLRLAQRTISAATGQQPTHFRPPLGRFDDRVVRAAARLNMGLALWTNVGITDAPEIVPDTLVERLSQHVYPGAVVMLHQDRAATLPALEGLLARLDRAAYQSVTLNMLETSQDSTNSAP